MLLCYVMTTHIQPICPPVAFYDDAEDCFLSAQFCGHEFDLRSVSMCY